MTCSKSPMETPKTRRKSIWTSQLTPERRQWPDLVYGSGVPIVNFD